VLANLDTRQQALVLGHAVPMPVVVQTRAYDEQFYRYIEQRTRRAVDLVQAQQEVDELFPD
jgi:DNA helicase HerA-like ATPase